MMRVPTFIIVTLCAVLTAAPVYGQEAQTAAQKKAEARKLAKAVEYRIDNDMTQMTNLVEAMAKNLGQLHHIRTLCFGQSDQRWRNYAGRMMDMEAKGDPALRQELVRAFNAGFYEQQGRNPVCDSTVSIEAAALSENGRRLANMLSDPYRER